jgi:hypothetical protein
MNDISEDFARLDDSALLSLRAEMRAGLERLPPGLGENELRAPTMSEPVSAEAIVGYLPPS